jgi:hypothetical protein
LIYNKFCNSETLKNSRGFSGSGTATYPNGDIYEGQFQDGVKLTFSFNGIFI